MEFSNDIIDLLALRVTADFQDKVKGLSGACGGISRTAWKDSGAGGLPVARLISFTASSVRKCVI